MINQYCSVNAFVYGKKKTVVKIAEITEVYIQTDNGIRYSHDQESQFGIPITGDILVDSGFKKLDNDMGVIVYAKKTNHPRIKNLQLYRTDNGTFTGSWYFAWFRQQRDIQFVHDLQALLFADKQFKVKIKI